MAVTAGSLVPAVTWSAHGPRISARGDDSALTNAMGMTLTWGDNTCGQLGLGDATSRTSPTQVGTGTNWTAVACGEDHTVALGSGGTLWAWGDNTYGELGLGDSTSRTSPTQVGTGTSWTAVACGYGHTVALESNGTLWAWGDNADGELGLGDTTNRTSPVQVGTDSNWVAVACGDYYTVALKSNGTLWAWGYNADGELGLGDTTNRTSPVQVGTDSSWVAVACGDYHTRPSRATALSLGLGLQRRRPARSGATSDADAHPTRPRRAPGTTRRPVAGACTRSVALESNGTLWALGLQRRRRARSRRPTTNRTSPVQVGTDSNWVAVACGDYHTLALESNGTLWAWGDNADGQLGLGTSDSDAHPTPTAVPPEISSLTLRHASRPLFTTATVPPLESGRPRM